MHNPSNLRVRARAFDFVVALYKAYQRQPARTARGAPGLCPQLLRAATSISVSYTHLTLPTNREV